MNEPRWTRRSYDAVFNWTDKTKRSEVRQILLADGLTDVINRLDNATSLGDWHRITKEAAEAVGPDIVSASADMAEIELARLSG